MSRKDKRMVADNKVIGHKIKKRRESLRISQEKLGEMIGVTYQQVQKYEKGTNKVSAERLSKIATILDVPISFFFAVADDFKVSDEREDKAYVIQQKKSLSIQEQEMLENFRSLPDKDARTFLVRFIKSVCKK